MSASELLENAVKFSNHDGIRMMIKKDSKKNEIVLVVFNYSAKKEAESLIERVETMNKEDPLQYYIAKMKESAIREDGKSCLGLARINYEGEAKLDVKYFDDEIVQVKAVFKLNSK
jgi:hypothetical protein